jgi:hypothetical protein
MILCVYVKYRTQDAPTGEEHSSGSWRRTRNDYVQYREYERKKILFLRHPMSSTRHECYSVISQTVEEGILGVGTFVDQIWRLTGVPEDT